MKKIIAILMISVYLASIIGLASAAPVDNNAKRITALEKRVKALEDRMSKQERLLDKLWTIFSDNKETVSDQIAILQSNYKKLLEIVSPNKSLRLLPNLGMNLNVRNV